MRRQQWIGLLTVLVVVGLVVALKARQPEAAPQKPSLSEQALAAAPLPKLVELASPLCHVCQQMVPVMDKLRGQVQGKVDVVVVDVTKDAKTADKYKVTAVPTLVFLDPSGKEVFRHVGFWSGDQIKAKLRELGWL